MTEFVYRITAICPAELLDPLRRISEALGYGASTFSLPLSPTGAEPATHYASSTIARQGFHDMLTDPATQDAVLASINWTLWGFSGEEEARLILRAQKDADPPVMATGSADTRANDQLEALLTAHGLQRVSSATAGP